MSDTLDKLKVLVDESNRGLDYLYAPVEHFKEADINLDNCKLMYAAVCDDVFRIDFNLGSE